jgi:hypothetical protein
MTMPESNSFADFIRDLEKLLAAVAEHEDLLPNIDAHLEALQLALEEVKDIKSRQESRLASKQRATQELGDAVAFAKDQAFRLRGAVKAHLGPRNELLVQFGIAPVRNRTRRATVPATPPAPQPNPVPPPTTE